MSLVETLIETLPADWKLDSHNGFVEAHLDTQGLVIVKVRPTSDGEKIRVYVWADTSSDSIVGEPQRVTELVEQAVKTALGNALVYIDLDVIKELPRWALVLITDRVREDHKDAQSQVEDVDVRIKHLQSEREQLQARVEELNALLGVLEA